ncbi:MAG TPA: hypothetical protein VGB64_13965 [Actinomycetota bacterium]
MKALLAGVAVIAMLAVPRPSHACSCTVRAPGAYLSEAGAAFRGEVVTVAHQAGGSVVALFDVAVVYKGELPQAVGVRTGGDEAGCGLPFAQGGIYVVFATGDPAALTAHLCGGTTDDRTYLDREGIAPIRDYDAAPAPVVPSPGAQASPPEHAPAGTPVSRGGPIAAAWIAALAAGMMLIRVGSASGGRTGKRPA